MRSTFLVFHMLTARTLADLTYTVEIVEGTSSSNCDDSFLNTNDDAVWGAQFGSQGSYLLMKGSGYDCPDRSPPQTLYTEERECDSQRSAFTLCLLAGDDNENSAGCDFAGTTVQESELGCTTEGCTTYSTIWDDCFSADCGASEDVAFDISGGNSVKTTGAVFRVTRSGNCVTNSPTRFPTHYPTESPSAMPTAFPSFSPTTKPTQNPTQSPIVPVPTLSPTFFPTRSPTTPQPTENPTRAPTRFPTEAPSISPTISPTTPAPSTSPTLKPSLFPTRSPTAFGETLSPTTERPTASPTKAPTTTAPTQSPTTSAPTYSCAGDLERCGGGESYEGTTCCLQGYSCNNITEELSLCQAAALGNQGSDPDANSESIILYAGIISAVFGMVVIFVVIVVSSRRRKKTKVREAAMKKFEKENMKAAVDDSAVTLTPASPFAGNADWNELDSNI